MYFITFTSFFISYIIAYHICGWRIIQMHAGSIFGKSIPNERTNYERRFKVEKAIFLDRDGVINEVLSERVKFVNKPEDFYLLEGVGQAIKKFNRMNYLVFVVTNQGGIGLGYMREQMLQEVHDKMKADISIYDSKRYDIAY